VAALLAVDSAAFNIFIFVLTVLPLFVLAVVIWVFFRAARRNDELEARAAAARQPPAEP